MEFGKQTVRGDGRGRISTEKIEEEASKKQLRPEGNSDHRTRRHRPPQQAHLRGSMRRGEAGRRSGIVRSSPLARYWPPRALLSRVWDRASSKSRRLMPAKSKSRDVGPSLKTGPRGLQPHQPHRDPTHQTLNHHHTPHHPSLPPPSPPPPATLPRRSAPRR